MVRRSAVALLELYKVVYLNYRNPRSTKSSGGKFLSIVYLIPLRKLPKSFPDPNLGGKSVVMFEACAVCIGDRYVAGLHADELPVAFEIIVLGQDALDDVVDVGEVALHITVVEDLNGLARLQFLRSGEVEHIRSARYRTFRFCSSCPYKDEFREILLNIQQLQIPGPAA